MNNLNILPLQISPGVVEKSAEMMEKDPHGAIITLVSVSVVFSALVILYIAYTLVGKTVNIMVCIHIKQSGNFNPGRARLTILTACTI